MPELLLSALSPPRLQPAGKKKKHINLINYSSGIVDRPKPKEDRSPRAAAGTGNDAGGSGPRLLLLYFRPGLDLVDARMCFPNLE